MNKAVAEFIGTFTLVFIGCGTVIFAAGVVGNLGIGLAFGMALIGMAYAIGPVSGCHINPAVSLGALIAGRMTMGEFIQYVIAQCAGAIVAAAVLFVIATGKTGGYDIASSGFAHSGWAEYGTMSAFLYEAVATFLFVVVILGATKSGPATMIAGLAIGLTLAAIHICGIPVSGASVNPARSLGPALFAGVGALSQLWLYIVAPLLGAACAGALFKTGMLDAE